MPNCVVGKCGMRSSRKTQYQMNVEKTSKVTFHKFPKDAKIRGIWMKNLNLKELTGNAAVCSLHFPNDAFKSTQLNTVQLKNTAVPCISHVNLNPDRNKDSPSHFKTYGPSTSTRSILPDLTLNVGSALAEEIVLSPASSIYVPLEESSQTTTENSEMLNNPDIVGYDADPLSIVPTDNISLFGDLRDTIEFVIEDDVCIVETNSTHDVTEITNLKETTIEQHAVNQDVFNVSVPSSVAEESHVEIDLTSPASLEEIKEEIEVEEPHVQFPDKQQTENIFEGSVSYENRVDTTKDDVSKNNTCYVSDCTVNSQDEVHWFRVPADENLKKIWDICIDRKDKRLSNQDVVCHKHFSETDIIFEVAGSSKSEATVSHGNPKLRQGAVPCIKFHEECCVPSCKTTSGKMYCFPVARTSDFHLWLYMIKNPELKNLKMKDVLRHRVCELHFEPDFFDDQYTLKRIAAPTLKLPETYTPNLIAVKCSAPPDLLNTSGKKINNLLCAHRECANTGNTGKNFFKFPTNPARCIAWLKACGRENMITTPFTTVHRVRAQTLAVCEDHFEFHQFATTMDRLEAGAIPKACALPRNAFRESKAFEPNILKKPVVKAVADKNPNVSTSLAAFIGHCFYKGCFSKPSRDNIFFSFPNETSRYNLWLKACGRQNLSVEDKNNAGKSQRICSKHFEKEMFESENKLKNDAVPVICENTSDPLNEEKDTEDNFTLTDDANQKEAQNNKPETSRLHCAVENCSIHFKASRGRGSYHRFPYPSTDSERFKIWLQIIANQKLCGYSDDEIYAKYMVCSKHFETCFYEDIGKSRLVQNAVPTANLTADIQWFYDTEFYKTLIQSGVNHTPEEDLPQETIEWRKDDVIDIDAFDDKTKCVLEEDRIRFPGMGHYLYLGKRKHPSNRKFPYGVYKHFKSGYGLNSDVKVGENIRIHTAIIIDDDDDCERAVLQQLLDKHKKV